MYIYEITGAPEIIIIIIRVFVYVYTIGYRAGPKGNYRKYELVFFFFHSTRYAHIRVVV